MAFVPRVHNREVPVANKQVLWRAQRDAQDKHRRTLNGTRARVENKWGGSWNGVKELKQASYSHINNNLKRAQLQDERYAEIELENYMLLNKLSRILERSHNPTVNTREWGKGVRLDKNQVPIIDHCVSFQTNEKGAALEASSLNIIYRQNQRIKIEKENRELVRRLQQCKPTYDNNKCERDARYRANWIASHNSKWTKGPRLLAEATYQQYGRPYSAPMAPLRPGGTLRSAGLAAGFGSRAVPRRDRATSHKPTTGKDGRAAAADREKIKLVLDVLASQMEHKTTLEQARLARETLMDNYYQAEEGTKIESLVAESGAEDGGVQIEVVHSPQAQAVAGAEGDASVLFLVHGGMFRAGSARGVRHLASRLSAELGVPVATPSLSLAPEHKHPRARDDVTRAYNYVCEQGVRPQGGTPPQRVAVVAESSGASLALLMLQGLQVGAAAPLAPCALAVLSPWADLTCNEVQGGSFTINKMHDPVLLRERLLDCVVEYVGSADAASSPDVSPLLADDAAFANFPPTLIHCGDTEVLLDDSHRLRDRLLQAGAAVTFREYTGVLHAWHLFFPLMPKAEQAVLDLVAFLRPRLDDAAVSEETALDVPPPAQAAPTRSEFVATRTHATAN